MPGLNLTRAEAQQRSTEVSEVGYQVLLDLTTGDTTFGCQATITFRGRIGGATWLDFIASQIDSVVVNGTELDVESVYTNGRIELADLAEFNQVVVTAQSTYMSTGEGLHRFVDPLDNSVYLYSQCEVADARRIFPVFEQPDIKAPLTLTLRAPAHWQVISNRPTPVPTPQHDGSAIWHFDPTLPLPSYLYAVIAGDYYAVHEHYKGPHGDYPLGLFCRRSLADSLDAEEIFTITKQGLAFFEDTFAYPYPFAKYDQIFVPEFNAGAMENPGAVTFHEDHYIFRSKVTDAAHESRAETILHEMAHMWFGDLVTMKWWDDLWLNESFAEWAAHHVTSKATRFPHAWASFANLRKSWAYRQDQLPSTHPIAADMVDLESVYANFDGITYAKGASVLKQLVAYVGEDDFITGLRDYFQRHTFGNTEFADLLAALQRSSGKDLSNWAQQWLQTCGTNTISVAYEVDALGNYSSFTVCQAPPSAPEGVEQVLRAHRVGIGLYQRDQQQLALREQVQVDIAGARTEVEELIGKPAADLVLPNDGDLTYTKIRLDSQSLQAAGDALADLADPLARALIWSAAWDMTRDAELATGDFVALVAGALPAESDVGLVSQVLRQVRTAVSLFADPARRGEYLTMLASSMREAMFGATARSDHQLAYARGLIMFAGSGDIALLRDMLSGNDPVSGLLVDAELQWSIVVALVALGAAGEETIEQQLARDHSAAGLRHALTARASAPDLTAKQQAWDRALDDATLPNASLEATIAGIMQPMQADLSRSFIERYFAALPRIARTRTQEITSQIVAGLYPALVVETSVIERTETFLAANPDFPAFAARLLIEAKDGVRRSLLCVARDRG